MDSLEEINKKLDTSRNVKKVVTTMKALAVTNIKLYEKNAEALYQYKSNIELGIQAIVSNNFDIINEFCEKKDSEKKTKDVTIIYGSNQGLCGKFNDKILDFFVEDLEERDIKLRDVGNFLIVVGNKLRTLFENQKFQPDVFLPMPNLVEDTVDTVHSLLNSIDKFKEEFNIGKILLYYISYDGSISSLTKKQLLPIDQDFLQEASEKVWSTNNIPFWRVDTKSLLLDFLRQFMFINLYYSLVTSIASEQKYRLTSLQNSEKNISDLITEMKLEYNQRRQDLITSEMLDIISGYNMLKD